MDHIAKKIMKVYESMGHDAAYLESKRIELSECENKYESFCHARNLDASHLAALAAELECDPEFLKSTLNFLSWYV